MGDQHQTITDWYCSKCNKLIAIDPELTDMGEPVFCDDCSAALFGDSKPDLYRNISTSAPDLGGTAAEVAASLQEEISWYAYLDEAATALNAQHQHEITPCPLTMRGEHCPICGTNRPRIVCLCGSTRFWQAYQEANLRETMRGNIVLTVGCDTKSDGELFSAAELARLKPMFDLLHLRKIDMADEVFILNVGGYIGESTRREIAYARANGKTIRFLEGTCISCDCCGVECFSIAGCGKEDCACVVSMEAVAAGMDAVFASAAGS